MFKKQRGITGLELIAFVVVAAVFAYTALAAGIFAKSETAVVAGETLGVGNGTKTAFLPEYPPKTGAKVFVDGAEVEHSLRRDGAVVVNPAPKEGARITISYTYQKVRK